jgi:hypothetical protein
MAAAQVAATPAHSAAAASPDAGSVVLESSLQQRIRSLAASAKAASAGKASGQGRGISAASGVVPTRLAVASTPEAAGRQRGASSEPRRRPEDMQARLRSLMAEQRRKKQAAASGAGVGTTVQQQFVPAPRLGAAGGAAAVAAPPVPSQQRQARQAPQTAPQQRKRSMMLGVRVGVALHSVQGDGSDECPVAQVAGLEVAEVKRSVVVADGVDCEGVALGEEVRLWGWAL